MYEYLENDPSTWKYHEPPYLDPKWQERINEFAGLNRHGKPNLRLVWAGTLKSDRTEDGKELKYHSGWTPFEVQGYRYKVGDEWHFTQKVEDIPVDVMLLPETRQEELGMLRFVAEKWTSPEELERQHRFQNRYAPGDLAPTLRKFPREGVYDTYVIIESEAGLFRRIDGAVIEYLKAKWHYDKLPFEQREAMREEYLAKEKAAKDEQYEDFIESVLLGDVKLSKEETERREEYWAKLPERRDYRGTHI